MGVVGDFSGNMPTGEKKALRDRKFVNIDRDNINDVLKSMTPGVSMEVENTLAGDGSMMKVNLKFESMEDFSPAKVAEQVSPLKKLLDARNQLKDLRTKIDVSTDLEATLEQVLKATENVNSLASELGIEKGEN
jgi:type VI secretion system protein ImpB